MKKTIIMIMILSVLLCFSGCGSNGVKATIETNSGKTVSVSAEELEKLEEENEISFKDEYWCAPVTVEGKVKEITSSCSINGTYYSWTVVIEGGELDWFVGKTMDRFSKTTVTEEFLASISVGDVVRIKGDMVGVMHGQCNISNGTTSIELVN